MKDVGNMNSNYPAIIQTILCMFTIIIVMTRRRIAMIMIYDLLMTIIVS